MSRDATAKLAKVGWITLVLYVLANRFVGLLVGRLLADMLVPVLAVVAISLAVYSLAKMRTHGTRGILGHAVATLLVGALLLAIWIPNFLSARERASAAGDNRQVLTVHVTRDGVILMNGAAVGFDVLQRELRRVSSAGGVMRYSRDDPSAEPHPNAMAVIKAASDTNISIQMSTPDEK